MAKQKKEKQIPYQQQIYEQMLTKQLYGDQDPASRIEANYNEWLNKKNSAAKIEENYNAWLKNRNEAKQAETQTVEAPTVDTKPVEEPIQKTTIQKKSEPKREQKKYLTHADVMPQLQKRSVDVTNYPEMAKSEQGGTVDLFNRPKVDTNELKKAGWKDAGEGTATVFSSTYTNAKGDKAGNFTPIVTDAKGNYLRTLSEDELTRYAESVLDGRRKDDLKLQIGKAQTGKKAIDNAVNAAEKVHTEQEEYYLGDKKSKATKASNEAKSIAKLAKQLGISEDEVRKRMSAPQQELNAYDEKKVDKKTTEMMQAVSSENARKRSQKKYSTGEAFLDYLGKPIIDVVDMPAALLKAATGKDLRFLDATKQQELKNAKEQHPVASTAGNFAGYVLAADFLGGGAGAARAPITGAKDVFKALRDDAILNGATKKEAISYALKGAIPQLLKNAAKAMPIDVAVDIAPTLVNDIAAGEKTPEEIARDTAANTFINYGFDTVGDVISLARAMKNTNVPFNGGSIDDAAKQLSDLEAPKSELDELSKLYDEMGNYSIEPDLPTLNSPRFTRQDLASNNPLLGEVISPRTAQIGGDIDSLKPSYAERPTFARESLDELLEANNRSQRFTRENLSANNPFVREDLAPRPSAIRNNMEALRPASGNKQPFTRENLTGINDIAENATTKPSYKLPDETFEKLDSRFEEIARPLNMVEKSGIMNTVTDEKALKEWKAVNEAYSDYLNKAMFGESIEEAEAAKKTLDNARKRYGRAMKNIDPNIAKAFNNGTFGNQIGRPIYDRNVLKAEGQTDEMLDIINELEGNTAPAKEIFENTKENFADVKPEKPIYMDAKGKRPYAKNQGVSPAIENEAKRIDKWIEEQGLEQELAEAEAKSVGQNIDNATRKVPGAEPLQFFGGEGKDRWAISKVRSNTLENQGLGDILPEKDFAYRRRSTAEQHEIKAERYKDSKDITTDLLNKDYDSFDAADIKASMDEINRLADENNVRRANILSQRLAYEGGEGGRKIQAFAEYNKNTFEGALRDANRAQEDKVIKPWKSRHKNAAEGNSRIAKALEEMGYKKPSSRATKPLTHEEIKKGVIAEIEREVGSVNEHFNDNDIEYLTMLAEDRSIPIWQITSEIEHKLNTGNWYTLDESLPIPKPTNRKLMNALDSLVTEKVRVEKPEPTLNELIEQVKNTLAKESANIEGEFTENDVQYLANLIHEGAGQKELANALNLKMATGSIGVSDETLQEVNNIFKDISRYKVDSKAFVEGKAKAYALLANEILPKNASFLEKYDAWRYIAMLGNFKTAGRNLGGNTLFGGMTGFSNTVSAVAEEAIDKIAKKINGVGIERTKSVLNPISDKNLILESAKDAPISRYAQLSGSKYKKMDENALRSAKSVFNSRFAKGYEKASKIINSDYPATRTKYSTSLAGYLKANGFDESIFKAEDELQRLKNLGESRVLTNAENARINQLTKDVNVLEKARDYAVKQAEYATFHEDNKVAQVLSAASKFSRTKGYGILDTMIKGTVPFLQIPSNVLRSGVEYSPLNSLKSIFKTGKLIVENTGKRAGNLADTYKLFGKDVDKETAAGVIDDWSKTFTGTGLTALGYWLYDKGILHISDPDTKYQDQLEGRQRYSLEINGKSISIDWAAPFVMPIIMGGEMAKMWGSTGMNTEDFYDNVNSFVEIANRISDPMLEMSFLSGVKDTLDTAAEYSRNDEAMNILPLLAYQTATGYVTQGIPTISGQIARTVDPIRRSTYTDKTGVAGVIDKQIKKVKNKLPFVSTTNEPYINTYGETEKNSPFDNFAGNLAYQMFSPSYISDINVRDADKVSREAYGVSKKASTLPKWQGSFKDANGKRLSPEKYTRAATAYGKAEKDIRTAYANDKWFKSLTPAEKEGIIDDVNSLATKVARSTYEHNYSPDDKAYQVYKKGGTKALLDYTHRKFINDKYDLSESDGATAVFDKYGEKGVKNYAKVKKALNKSQATEDIKNAIDRTLPTLSDNEKAIYYSYLDTDANPGTNPFGYVPGINYNVEKDKPYQRAKAVLPKLSPEKFHEERDKIDKWGDESRGASYGNKKISEKEELLPYINATAKSLEEAQQLYDAYGNQLTNKNGVKKHIIQKGGQYVSTY